METLKRFSQARRVEPAQRKVRHKIVPDAKERLHLLPESGQQLGSRMQHMAKEWREVNRLLIEGEGKDATAGEVAADHTAAGPVPAPASAGSPAPALQVIASPAAPAPSPSPRPVTEQAVLATDAAA